MMDEASLFNKWASTYQQQGCGLDYGKIVRSSNDGLCPRKQRDRWVHRDGGEEYVGHPLHLNKGDIF
jgi:hypothetical protein